MNFLKLKCLIWIHVLALKGWNAVDVIKLFVLEKIKLGGGFFMYQVISITFVVLSNVNIMLLHCIYCIYKITLHMGMCHSRYWYSYCVTKDNDIYGLLNCYGIYWHEFVWWWPACELLFLCLLLLYAQNSFVIMLWRILGVF